MQCKINGDEGSSSGGRNKLKFKFNYGFYGTGRDIQVYCSRPASTMDVIRAATLKRGKPDESLSNRVSKICKIGSREVDYWLISFNSQR